MSPEFKVSDILPSFGSMNRHPLPSPGSLRAAVPRFPRYYGMLRSPDTRPLPLVALKKGTAPSAEISGSPGFLGDPVACMPRPSIPAEPGGSGLNDPRMLPSARRTASASATLRFRDCIPAACMLPVYASCPRGHATLGSGRWPTLAGRGLNPRGRSERFRRSTCASPFPKLFPAHSPAASILTSVQGVRRIHPLMNPCGGRLGQRKG